MSTLGSLFPTRETTGLWGPSQCMLCWHGGGAAWSKFSPSSSLSNVVLFCLCNPGRGCWSVFHIMGIRRHSGLTGKMKIKLIDSSVSLNQERGSFLSFFFFFQEEKLCLK